MFASPVKSSAPPTRRGLMTGTVNGAGDTGFTALFIRRPVMAFVLNALIVVAGLAAFYGVEIRELPDVDRPSSPSRRSSTAPRPKPSTAN